MIVQLTPHAAVNADRVTAVVEWGGGTRVYFGDGRTHISTDLSVEDVVARLNGATA